MPNMLSSEQNSSASRLGDHELACIENTEDKSAGDRESHAILCSATHVQKRAPRHNADAPGYDAWESPSAHTLSNGTATKKSADCDHTAEDATCTEKRAPASLSRSTPKSQLVMEMSRHKDTNQYVISNDVLGRDACVVTREHAEVQATEAHRRTCCHNNLSPDHQQHEHGFPRKIRPGEEGRNGYSPLLEDAGDGRCRPEPVSPFHFRTDFSRHLSHGDQPALFFLRSNEGLAIIRVEGNGRLLMTLREEAGARVMVDRAVVHDSAAHFAQDATLVSLETTR